MLKHTTRLIVTALITLPLLVAQWSHAAEVPPGTKLAAEQHLVRANGADPTTLDPQLSESRETSNVIADSFAGLVTLDAFGKVHPELAERWDNQQNLRWTFYLRPDIKWSNGEPITAEDVVFSWQRLANPQTASLYQSFIQMTHMLNVDQVVSGEMPVTALGVKALDNRTIQVTLSQPVSYFLQLVGYHSLFPVSKNLVEKYGDQWTQLKNIAVSGAFKPVSWTINEKLVAKRNPSYWNHKAVVLEQVTYLPINEPQAVLNRYQAGEIDITDQIPTINYPALKQSSADQIISTPLLGMYFYQFNTTLPPFNDPRVRRALSLGLDRSIITDKVVAMGQQPAYAAMPLKMGDMTFTAPDYAGWSQEQRNVEAKRLLSEAGFTAQKPLAVELFYNTSQDHQRIAIAIASIWKKNLGVKVTLRNQEWKTLLQTMHEGNFSLARYSWLADYDDPSTFLTLAQTGNSQNNSRYSNPQFDQLLVAASRATDVEQIRQLYQQASDILARDVPAIPIYYSVQNQLIKPWVGGLSVSHNGFYASQDMYIKQH